MKTINKLFLVCLLFINNSNILAAGNEVDNDLMKVASAMLVITFLIILLVFWLAVVYSEKNDSDGNLFLSPLRKFLHFLTKSTPIENEQSILLSHDYDGIKELDNRIPPWFHALFWGAIIFGAIYLVKFHVIGSGNVQEEEYLEEVRLAEAEQQILIKTGALLNEETVTASTDAAVIQEGKGIFVKNCVACHGQNAEGIVGPNLTDDYWIHGGGIKNVFKTIKYGVPQKGMISWQSQLNPNQMQAVSSYVLSLHGTNPPNAKAPEGVKYEEKADSTLSGANS
jgi:cytochrome c oxidase cbb3-type subunit 3